MKDNVLLMEIDKPLYETIHSVQYDRNSRFVHVKLLNNSLPFDLTNKRVILSGSKPDGEEIFNTCKIVEDLVVIEITEDMNAVPGVSEYSLEIYGGDMSLLQTKNFKIKVTPSVRSNKVESRSEVKALTDALSEVQNIDNRFAETNAQLSQKAIVNNTSNVNTVSKDIVDLNFNTASISRQVNLLNDDFVYFHDNFNSDYGLYDEISLGASGVNITKNTNNGTFEFVSDNWVTFFRKTKKANTIPFTFMELGVDSFGTQTSGTQSVGVGLIRDISNYLMVIYDSINKILKVDIKLNGETVSRVETNIELTEPCKIGFCQNENSISMFLNKGNGWEYINHAGSYKGVLDLTNPINMKDWYHGYAIFTNKANTVKLNSFRSGAFGQVGVRDHNLIRYTDGTPLIINNEVYLSATSGGVRNSIPGSHWSVFSMNLSSYEVKERAKILIKREGLVLGDHAGNIVYDNNENCFHIFVSNWGDWTNVGPAKIVYGKCYNDLLNGIHVIDEVRYLNIPTTVAGNSAYDPDVVKYDDKWHIFYTESSKTADTNSFSAHVAGDTLDNLMQVADDRSALSGSYEGCKVQKIGGEWFVFSSNLTEYRCCKAEDMSFVCNVKAPEIGNNSAKPHFTIIPIPYGNKTKLIVVSFDNTQYSSIGIHTRGNWYVFENDKLLDGYEFQLKRVPNIL